LGKGVGGTTPGKAHNKKRGKSPYSAGEGRKNPEEASKGRITSKSERVRTNRKGQIAWRRGNKRCLSTKQVIQPDGLESSVGFLWLQEGERLKGEEALRKRAPKRQRETLKKGGGGILRFRGPQPLARTWANYQGGGTQNVKKGHQGGKKQPSGEKGGREYPGIRRRDSGRDPINVSRSLKTISSKGNT